MQIVYEQTLLQFILEKHKRTPISHVTLSESDFEDCRCEANRNYYEGDGGAVNEGDTWFSIEGISCSFHLSECFGDTNETGIIEGFQ